MISSEDIEIKLKDSVKLPATVKIYSLFLQQDETLVFDNTDTTIKRIHSDSPEFRCEGQVTCRAIKDLCGYDQYSVLLLQDEGVWRADLQTGHSKLVTRITPTAHSVVCNKQYIFVGATPQFDQRENTILVFDRGSGK